MLRQFTTSLTFETHGRGLLEVTQPVTEWVAEARLTTGLLTVFVRHTSASLLIQENADPDVRGDLDRFFARLVQDGDPLFRHHDEGADDMPAHVRAALTAVELAIPLSGGGLVLGTWQGIYLHSPASTRTRAAFVGRVMALTGVRCRVEGWSV